jgi:hypothetical protein
MPPASNSLVQDFCAEFADDGIVIDHQYASGAGSVNFCQRHNVWTSSLVRLSLHSRAAFSMALSVHEPPDLTARDYMSAVLP